ncbi:ARM repeat-containing protein [Wallemia mellicola]|nr:ARM repeat-containing protein [Wallemia mellicola]
MSTIKLLTIIYDLENSTLDKLLSVILSQLNDDNELDFYTLILTQLLNHKQAKHFIYDHLDVLLKQLNNSNIQSNYNIIYSIWLLTFDKSLSARINSDYKIIPPLAQLARSSIKEKVVRLVLAIFVNLLKHSKQSTLATFLALPIQPTLNNLSSRRWNDAELQTDLDTITEQLQSSFASISNWDEYSSELESGLLRWSPVHTDEDFWKNQSGALLKDNNWGLKRLFSLLDSEDQQILHITLYDISQCLKFIHHAKTYVDSSSKQKIMELLQHPDPKIKYQALITTQLLISQPWN